MIDLNYLSFLKCKIQSNILYRPIVFEKLNEYRILYLYLIRNTVTKYFVFDILFKSILHSSANWIFLKEYQLFAFFDF